MTTFSSNVVTFTKEIQMAKKSKSSPTSLRLGTDDQNAIRLLSEHTGWSFTKTLTFVVAAGWDSLNDAKYDPTKRQAVITAAITLERQRQTAAAAEATAAKALRVATAALTPPNPHVVKSIIGTKHK